MVGDRYLEKLEREPLKTKVWAACCIPLSYAVQISQQTGLEALEVREGVARHLFHPAFFSLVAESEL